MCVSQEALFFDASHWDVYALGVLLWSLWFRRDPWPRSFQAVKIMAAVTRGRRPPFAPPPPPSGGGTRLASRADSLNNSAGSGLTGDGGGGGGGSGGGYSSNTAGSLWGDMNAALPPPPALRSLVERMWSPSHSMRGEVRDVMEAFNRDVAPHLLRLNSARTGCWERGALDRATRGTPRGSSLPRGTSPKRGASPPRREPSPGLGDGSADLLGDWGLWGKTWVGPAPEPLPSDAAAAAKLQASTVAEAANVLTSSASSSWNNRIGGARSDSLALSQSMPTRPSAFVSLSGMAGMIARGAGTRRESDAGVGSFNSEYGAAGGGLGGGLGGLGGRNSADGRLSGDSAYSDVSENPMIADMARLKAQQHAGKPQAKKDKRDVDVIRHLDCDV